MTALYVREKILRISASLILCGEKKTDSKIRESLQIIFNVQF